MRDTYVFHRTPTQRTTTRTHSYTSPTTLSKNTAINTMRSQATRSPFRTCVSTSPTTLPSLEHRHASARWCGFPCVRQGARSTSTEEGNASSCSDTISWWMRPSRCGSLRSIQTLLLSNAVPSSECSYPECSTTCSNSLSIACSALSLGKTLRSTQ